MALLKNRRTTPPGGWTYVQFETQAAIKGENEDQLIGLVVAHRKYKGLEPTEPDAVRKDIERQICVKLSRGDCKSEGAEDPWVPADNARPVITMTQVLAFSRAAFEFLKSGMKLVPREVAEARAEICKGCPENREMTGCSCGIYHKVIASSIPEDRKISGVHVCWRCGCDLISKVNLEDSVIVASNKGLKIDYPSFCWQRRVLEQHSSQGADIA